MTPRVPPSVPSPEPPARPGRPRHGPADARFPAVAAEPPGPGSGAPATRSRREVRLLGALLGQVIAEQAGPELFALVERIRRRTIALRRGDPGARAEPDVERERLTSEIAGLDLADAAAVVRAFTLYFQLVNLAEERERIRVLRTPRAPGPRRARSTIRSAEAVARLAAHARRGAGRGPMRRPAVVVHPVLTAHPTEARRRTLLVALRRIRRLLDALDDSATHARRGRATSDAACARRSRSCGRPRTCGPWRPRRSTRCGRRWRSSTRRCSRSSPGSSGRSTGRSTRRAAGPRLPAGVGGIAAARRRDATPAGPGTRPRAAPARPALRLWIGGDRDGHPGVTAEVTLQAARLQADHVLRGYEAVAPRLMQTVAARGPAGADRPRRSAARSPATPRSCPRRSASSGAASPTSRTASGSASIAERLRRTRAALTGETAPRTGRYAEPAALDAELAEIQEALVADGLGAGRLGRGRRPALAARDVRVPPRLARGPPARRGPRGGARGAARPAPARSAEVAARRHAGRGPRHVPAIAAPPGALRRRGLPALRHHLHDLARRT